jgi:hypothetical protein
MKDRGSSPLIGQNRKGGGMMAGKKGKKPDDFMDKFLDDCQEWDRRFDLKETDSAYKYFCIYRDSSSLTGERRSLRKTAEQAGVKPSTLSVYANKYDWYDRVRAYDLFLEKSRRTRYEEELDKMYATHAKVGNSLIVKAMKKLLNTPDEMLTINDVIKLLDLGVKTERISRGEVIEGRLRNQKLQAEIDNLTNANNGDTVEIVDDIPLENEDIVDDIPLLK